MELMNELKEHKIIAIVRGIPQELGDPTAEALMEGGIRFIEVTMNTDGALDMITNWKNKFGNEIRVGAGSVYDLELAEKAIKAGAEYIISPNLDEDVVAYCVEQGVPVFPGTMTPTEIYRAYKAGAHAVKVFPAGSLGPRYIKELQGPLGHIPMIATGGVTLENMKDYIQAGVFALGVGGSLVEKSTIIQKDFSRLRSLAEQYTQKIREINGY